MHRDVNNHTYTSEDINDTKLAINNIDSGFRWIQLHQKQTYERETRIHHLLKDNLQSARMSLLVKLTVFLAIATLQTLLIRAYMRRDYELII